MPPDPGPTVAKATLSRPRIDPNPMEHSEAMLRLRLVPLALVLVLLTACDGYIEQVTLDHAGAVEFRAEATVVCNDPLQREVWGGDGCDQIDAMVRGADAGDLPFDFEVDPNRLSLVNDGDLDRRRLDARWEGKLDELETVLVGSGTITILDENRTEATFTTAGSVAEQFFAEADGYVADDSAWETAQFRVIVPEVVVEHNGDDIQGRTVVWRFDGDLPDEFRVVWSSEERGAQVWWWVVAGTILLAVLAMMAVLEGPNRGRTEDAVGDDAADANSDD